MRVGTDLLVSRSPRQGHQRAVRPATALTRRKEIIMIWPTRRIHTRWRGPPVGLTAGRGRGLSPVAGRRRNHLLMRASAVGKHILESRRDEGVSTAPAPRTTRIARPLLPTRTPCQRRLVSCFPLSPHSPRCFLAGIVLSRRSILWRRQRCHQPSAAVPAPPAPSLPSPTPNLSDPADLTEETYGRFVRK